MLEDGIFGTESWLKDKKNQATAKKFLVASFKGWIYCRTHLKDCVRIVLSHGPTLLKGHQKWQMNEINALVWPSPLGIGLMSPKDYRFTAKTTAKYNHLKSVPGHAAYRTDLAKAAQNALKKQGIDIYGKGYKKAKIKVTLKNGVLDPQGKAIEGALGSLGFSGIEHVRQGKYFEIDLKNSDKAKAKAELDDICRKLLANTVIENYEIELA